MNALEAYRKRKGLTYQGLADEIGVKTPTTARNYCRDLSIPEPPVMRNIAVATDYEVTANHFYGIDPERRAVFDPTQAGPEGGAHAA